MFVYVVYFLLFSVRIMLTPIVTQHTITFTQSFPGICNNGILSALHSCFLQNEKPFITILTAADRCTTLADLHVIILVVTHFYKAMLPFMFFSWLFHACLSFVAQSYSVVFLKVLIASSMRPHGRFA